MEYPQQFKCDISYTLFKLYDTDRCHWLQKFLGNAKILSGEAKIKMMRIIAIFSLISGYRKIVYPKVQFIFNKKR